MEKAMHFFAAAIVFLNVSTYTKNRVLRYFPRKTVKTVVTLCARFWSVFVHKNGCHAFV